MIVSWLLHVIIMGIGVVEFCVSDAQSIDCIKYLTNANLWS
jgi:hypothetical protein